MPFAILFEAPDQARRRHIVPVAIDIRPDLHALADDALHRIAAAVDKREDVFDMEGAARCGALEGGRCSIHGDAIDMK